MGEGALRLAGGKYTGTGRWMDGCLVGEGGGGVKSCREVGTYLFPSQVGKAANHTGGNVKAGGWAAVEPFPALWPSVKAKWCLDYVAILELAQLSQSSQCRRR